MDADRHPGLDTLSGYDPDEDDPLMAALERADHALDDAIKRLKQHSDPPPAPLPPAAPAVPAVPAAA